MERNGDRCFCAVCYRFVGQWFTREVHDGSVWKKGAEIGEKRDASKEKRNSQVRQGRQRRKSQKQKASDCHWIVGSAQKRSEGSSQEKKLKRTDRGASTKGDSVGARLEFDDRRFKIRRRIFQRQFGDAVRGSALNGGFR